MSFWIVFISLTVIVLCVVRAQVDPGFNKEQMAARLKIACPIQPTADMAEKFYKCLYQNGLTYKVEKILCPCKAQFGFDTCTIAGSWKATCDPSSKINSPTDGTKIKDCILKNMADQSTEKNEIIMCEKAMKAVSKCAENMKGQAAKATVNNAVNPASDKGKASGNKPSGGGSGNSKSAKKQPNNNNKNKPSQPEMGAMAAIVKARGWGY